MMQMHAFVFGSSLGNMLIAGKGSTKEKMGQAVIIKAAKGQET